MKRYDIVDFSRGFAIFSIMMFHYLLYMKPAYPLNKMIFFGGTGIHLFILLSGFGLYYSYLHRPERFFPFLKRRLMKVYFPYIIVVSLSALLSLFIPVYKSSLYAYGGHVFLYKMFDQDIMGSYGNQLWFISMIFQFYFSFHVIRWFKSRFHDSWFIILSVLLSLLWATVVVAFGKQGQRVWDSFFLQFFWEFALGMVIAERVVNHKKINFQQLSQFTVLLIGIVNCAAYALLALKGGSWGKFFNDYFALIGYASITLFIYRMNLSSINRFFIYIGKISISVFLLHDVVFLTLATVFPNLNKIYVLIGALLIIFPVSLLFQRVVDALFIRRTASVNA